MSAITQYKNDLRAPVSLPEVVVPSLAGHVRRCYDNARNAKQIITERLLSCERQRRGEYDPAKLAQIRETGGSEVFLMLTDIKCRAADSWIKDVMQSSDSTWELAHAQEPVIPPQIHDQIVEGVTQEIMQAQQQGQPVTQIQIEQRMSQVYDQVHKQVGQWADQAADKMTAKVEGAMEDDQWDKTLSDAIYDFVTFPAMIIKGPIIRRKKQMVWGNGWVPVISMQLTKQYGRVSPYDAFPSPSATSCQDGYFIERHRLMEKDLSEMRGNPGYNDAEIEKAITQYGKSGLREMTFGETEREWLSGRHTSYMSGEIIEALEYWGPANGEMLIQWGMTGIDKYAAYEVNVWLVGECVIKAVLNPDPLGRRPYSKSCFVDIPGAFWGQALPELMSDTQSICNTSARALANNIGVASGPQVEVTVDRLPDGEDVTHIHPYKLWQTTSDKTGGGQPAIRFYQPNMNAEPLMGVLQYFSRIADEVTGVPNYIYGSNQVGGAGRTASGLSMLMDNASKGIKQAILSIDRAVREIVDRTIYYFNAYDPDHSIKGDLKAQPAGVVGSLIKDHVNEKRIQFLQMISNPIDAQLMGPEVRASLIEQIASGMQLKDVMPDQIGQMPNPEMQQAQQAMQKAQEEIQQLQQQLLDRQHDYALKEKDIAARIEVAHITSQATVESRAHENELRAITEKSAKEAQARIDTQSQATLTAMKLAADERMDAADNVTKVKVAEIMAGAKRAATKPTASKK